MKVDRTPLPCCGHSFGCHENGLCQIVLHNGWDGNPVKFCPCPDNEKEDDDDD